MLTNVDKFGECSMLANVANICYKPSISLLGCAPPRGACTVAPACRRYRRCSPRRSASCAPRQARPFFPLMKKIKTPIFWTSCLPPPATFSHCSILKVGTILKLHLNIVMLTSLFSKSRNESTNLQDSERTRGNFVVSQKCRNNEVENKNTQTLRRGFVRL